MVLVGKHETARWAARTSVVICGVIALVVALGACSRPPEDPRALPSSLRGVTLEQSLRDFDLDVPPCALANPVFRYTPTMNLGLSSRWLYLRLEVDEACLGETLPKLGVDESELTKHEYVRSYAVPASGRDRDEVPALWGGSVLPETDVRAELQILADIEEFDGHLYLHVRATL